jgi:hypothetical protein
MESVMKKLFVSLFGVMALSATFIAEAVAAYPLNQCDWAARRFRN